MSLLTCNSGQTAYQHDQNGVVSASHNFQHDDSHVQNQNKKQPTHCYQWKVDNCIRSAPLLKFIGVFELSKSVQSEPTSLASEY